MTEQKACTLCGAGGHLAAQCNWNKALELLRAAKQFTWDLQSPADLRLRIDDFLASQQGEQCTTPAGNVCPGNGVKSCKKCSEQAEGAQGEPLPYWEPCNPACDPELNGFRDRKCSCEQASAALAQPSPTLPPFAEKVLAKLRRFNECAEDSDSGGVDIGRHWLDLLTQLGLLNRVQRSPALWEISQQGEDLLGLDVPEIEVPDSMIEKAWQRFERTLQQLETPGQAEQAEQAEAERPEVVAWQYRVTAGPQTGWSLWHPGKGEEFERSYTVERRPLMTVAQHERIVGELRAEIDEVDGLSKRLDDLLHQTAIALRGPEPALTRYGYADLPLRVKTLLEERDAAQARVAELVAALERAATAMWNSEANMDNAAAEAEEAIGNAKSGAPVAQAGQVPELDQLYSMLGADDQVGAAKKIAELVGCRLIRHALTEAQMRRLYENSTDAENERLGFAAFARLMRRAEAVHQIAAAPAQGGE